MKPSPPLRPFARARAALAAVAGALGASLLLSGANAQDPTAQAPSVQLSAGIHLIHAELADNDPARARGLMFRTSLAPNHGMLFVFGAADTHCMWMRNTLIPLSVAFLDADGTVVNIEEMAPRTDQSHCARRPVRYALEMSGQWFGQHGVHAGSVLQGVAQAR
ncbi:Exported protein [Burkholderiales bacterium]|nr:Exported protein [Burkholderiales bacterium]